MKKIETQEGVYIIQEREHYGIINENNTIIIPCIYESIEYIPTDNIYLIRLNKKYGVLNTNFKTIVPPVYSGLYLWGKKFIAIIADGLSENFNWLWVYQKRKSHNAFYNPKYSLLDKDGQEIFHPRYDAITPVDESFATVTLGDYIGLINSCGIEIIPPIYDMEKDSMIEKIANGIEELKGRIHNKSNRYYRWELTDGKIREKRIFCFSQGNTLYVMDEEGTVFGSQQYLIIPRFDKTDSICNKDIINLLSNNDTEKIRAQDFDFSNIELFR